jgi:hypothetical protein
MYSDMSNANFHKKIYWEDSCFLVRSTTAPYSLVTQLVTGQYSSNSLCYASTLQYFENVFISLSSDMSQGCCQGFKPKAGPKMDPKGKHS